MKLRMLIAPRSIDSLKNRSSSPGCSSAIAAIIGR
ncbi:MAG: hypothetical protein ACFWTS_00890 [Pseudoclavibacter caeni]